MYQNNTLKPRLCLVLQVETLAGQVVAVEVDASASLTTIRSGIEREVGIAAKQQRLIILGEITRPF